MIRILIDSSADLLFEELQSKNIELVPLTITIGENSYIEGKNLSRDDFYKILTEGKELPKTSQPSPQSFVDVFEDVKAKGDEIVCILLSSALSGTYQSATLAKSMVEYDGIYLVDSLSAAAAIRVMADYACMLREEGKTGSEIASAVEEIKGKVKIAAMLDTLEYLYRGGRLSKTSATIGELAKVKPIITVTPEGGIGILGKCIGKVKAMNYIIKKLEAIELDERFPLYSIYSYGEENCQKFEEKLAANGFNIRNRLQLGATIGTHIGPGAFAVVYVEK